MTEFSGLDLIDPIQRAIRAEGYTTPTPIQTKAIPHLLAGSDLLGIAQTGTGKTAAFAWPILQILSRSPKRPVPGSPRALVLAPTRELAGQIGDGFRTYGRHLRISQAVVFGGVPIRRQIDAMRRGVDILVATPGRLLDLMGQGQVRLDRVQVFVLDEADRMLDMGFINDVKKITTALPAERQNALFSATMPEAVRRLAAGIQRDPVRVEVAPQSTAAERVDQRVLFVSRQDKRALLSQILGRDGVGRVLIFTRTKHGADKVARQLDMDGHVAGAIHGNKSQNARERALAGFRAGHIKALVATDIAARGIDVDGVTHVINYDLPNDPESYVHRIGRTARAGATGTALSLCDSAERPLLRSIEKTIRQSVAVDADHPYHGNEPESAPQSQPEPRARKQGPARRGGAPKWRRRGRRAAA